MLFQLILVRMGPIVLLRFCKERRQVKWMLILIFCIYSCCFLRVIFMIFSIERWKSLFYLPAAMFPHFFFYGFAGWLLSRCVFREWSQRVWERIYKLSCVSIFLGILTEIYLNPQILNFFVKNF